MIKNGEAYIVLRKILIGHFIGGIYQFIELYIVYVYV